MTPPTASGDVSPVYSNSCTPSTELTRSAPRISRLARTNAGVLMTSSDSTVMTRSDSWYCRIAPHAPTTTPMTVPSTEPMTSSRRLTPMRRHSSSDTGCPSMVVPKSPCTAPATQCAVAQRDRLVEVQLGGLGVDHGLRRPRVALQQAVQRFED